MNTLFKISLVVLLASLFGCNPTVRTTVTKKVNPLEKDQEVVVLPEKNSPPENAEKVGEVKVWDTGFTNKCSYEIVTDLAKKVARNAGGNVVKLTTHKKPNTHNICHRIIGDIYYVSDSLSMNEIIENNTVKDGLDTLWLKRSFIMYKGSRITMRKAAKITKINPLAYAEIQTAKSNNIGAGITSFIGGFCMGYTLGQLFNPDIDLSPGVLIVGLSSFGASFHFTAQSKKYARKSFNIYNAGLKETSSAHRLRLNFGVSPRGLGVNLNF